MDQATCNNLILAIKSDNLVLFSEITKDNISIKFGRFPILTLCFLYNSKKILRKFEKTLWQVKDYKEVSEPYELYLKFKSFAGRTIRLYTNEKSLVTPIEMLAILHQDSKVKSLYKKYKIILLDKVKRNLKSIYTIYGQEPYILTYKIKIKPRKLTRTERLPYKIGISFASAVILILTSLLLTFTFTTGLGTSSNPYKIYTENQFLAAITSKGNYILKTDLDLDKSLSALDIECNINCDGRTITLNGLPTSRTIFNTNTGSISNLNIVYPQSIDETITSSLSLFVKDNQGKISNISIIAENLNFTCNKTTLQDIYISGVANKNSGTIDNCTVQFDCDLTTTGNGECMVSGIVGENDGNIKNSTFTTNSQITANEADIAGIAINNSIGATISKCTNNASITQNSETNEWNPTVAGITLHNFGSIEHAINKGNLNITSTNSTENAQGNAFIGGVSANNYGTISGSLNKADISVTTKNIMVYAGGIAGYGSYWTDEAKVSHYPVINRSGTTGQISISTEHDKAYVFAGGIAGSYQYGEIVDSFSITDFTTLANEEKYFFGLLLGSSYVSGTQIYLTPINNHVAHSDNVEYQFGSLISTSFFGETSIVSAGINIDTGINVTSAEQIKSQGVYFDE